MKNFKLPIVLLALIAFLFAHPAQACDRSGLSLDQVTDLGGGQYQIDMTFTCGAGADGLELGADQNTQTYGFFLSGGATVLAYPSTLTSPQTAAVYTGSLFLSDSVLVYDHPSEWWACTQGCGPIQTVSQQISIVTVGLPTEITLLGMEGAGLAASGCQGPDMTVVPGCFGMAADAGADATVYLGYAPAACTNLMASGQGGSGSYSYAWSTGENQAGIQVCPSASTAYQVTVTDLSTGCSATDEVVVSVEDVSCGNGKSPKVLVCHDGQTRCVNANQVAAHLAHGDQLGSCAAGRWAPDVDYGEESDLGPDLILAPNPVRHIGKIYMELPGREYVSLRVFDLRGQLIAEVAQSSLEAGHHSLELDVSGWAPGIYLLKLEGDQGSSLTQKFMVE